MLLKRLYSTGESEALLRIGRSIRFLPTDYQHFFTRPLPSSSSSPIDLSPFNPNSFQFHLHNPSLLLNYPLDNHIDCIEGRQAFGKFLRRLRFTLKGWFILRVSDLSALQLRTIKIIQQPSAPEDKTLIVRVNWELIINNSTDSVYYSPTMNLNSLLKVQYYRFTNRSPPKPASAPSIPTPLILYTGMTRYHYNKITGWCDQVHWERVIPRIDADQSSWWQQWLFMRPRPTEPALNTSK